MNDDPLRDRLARMDPLFGEATPDPTTGQEHRIRLETVMNTPLDTRPAPTAPSPRGRRSTPALILGGCAAAVLAALVGVAVIGGDDTPDVAIAPTTIALPVTSAPATPPPGKLTVMELSAGFDDSLASCLALDPSIVAQAPIAFKGTVTIVDGDVVQLIVDQSYVGVDVGAVTLTAAEGMEALIGGVAWEVGQQYLVSAYDGVVAYCGQSGPASPELQAIYDAAFPA